jgi:hypothetical protein
MLESAHRRFMWMAVKLISESRFFRLLDFPRVPRLPGVGRVAGAFYDPAQHSHALSSHLTVPV